MRSAITSAAQSIFALFTGPAGARRDRSIESPDDALALFEPVVRAKDILRSASRRRRPTCASDSVGRLLQLFAHGAGGKPSERLINRLGMPVSDDTLLRHLKRGAARGASDVRVLGIDDWSWRKGKSYGTVMVDLERLEVVDVLPGRSAEETAGWLRQHPNVEVVSRDRCGLYAQGIRKGAPKARQVADRFHLLQNFRERIEHQLSRSDKGRACPSLPRAEGEDPGFVSCSTLGRQ
jgi:hypothetical protein